VQLDADQVGPRDTIARELDQPVIADEPAEVVLDQLDQPSCEHVRFLPTTPQAMMFTPPSTYMVVPVIRRANDVAR
jgi:hypothetical protein